MLKSGEFNRVKRKHVVSRMACYVFFIGGLDVGPGDSFVVALIA